jgi:hypothetical protein
MSPPAADAVELEWSRAAGVMSVCSPHISGPAASRTIRHQTYCWPKSDAGIWISDRRLQRVLIACTLVDGPHGWSWMKEAAQLL